MKTQDEIKKKISKLNELDKAKIKEITQALSDFSKKADISFDGLKTLYNLQTSIQTFTEQYTNRLVSILKQNHMLD